ncbi:hypothetical protein [Planomonospora algeriensis]
MYVVTAHLLAPPCGAEPPDLDRLRVLLYSGASADATIRHVYIRVDQEGLSLVLYVTATGLRHAENGTHAMLYHVLDVGGLTGWTIAYCGADVVPIALDMLLNDHDAEAPPCASDGDPAGS